MLYLCFKYAVWQKFAAVEKYLAKFRKKVKFLGHDFLHLKSQKIN
jgi:hypothetical protein